MWGDVMDISLLRMTILEDITLTSIHAKTEEPEELFLYRITTSLPEWSQTIRTVRLKLFGMVFI
jgi:hypothetical protein